MDEICMHEAWHFCTSRWTSITILPWLKIYYIQNPLLPNTFKEKKSINVHTIPSESLIRSRISVITEQTPLKVIRVESVDAVSKLSVSETVFSSPLCLLAPPLEIMHNINIDLWKYDECREMWLKFFMPLYIEPLIYRYGNLNGRYWYPSIKIIQQKATWNLILISNLNVVLYRLQLATVAWSQFHIFLRLHNIDRPIESVPGFTFT